MRVGEGHPSTNTLLVPSRYFRPFDIQELDPDWSPRVFPKSSIDMYTISKALESNPFPEVWSAANFTAAQKLQFISYMERVEFGAGVDIFKEGDEGDYFYVIASGACIARVGKKEVQARAPSYTHTRTRALSH